MDFKLEFWRFGGCFVTSNCQGFDLGFYTFTLAKMDAKKIISIRFELFKMFKDGYTHEQMQEFVKQAFDRWEVTLDEIVEALVDSRWYELVLNNRINAVVEALKS